ncbi:MAG: hypothetical protein AB7L09_02620 [Nitrospira sp.]
MRLLVGPPICDSFVHLTDYWAGGWNIRLYSLTKGNYRITSYHHDRRIKGPVVEMNDGSWSVHPGDRSVLDEVYQALVNATVLQQMAACNEST